LNYDGGVLAKSHYRDSLLVDDNGTSPWFGGLRLEDFPGATIGAQIANAAKSIKADVLSPNAYYFNSTATDPSLPGYIPFTTRDLIDAAHEVGLTVIPWTVNWLACSIQLTFPLVS